MSGILLLSVNICKDKESHNNLLLKHQILLSTTKMIHSNDAGTSLFEEDEEGTEVIPRSLPTPMEKVQQVKSESCHGEQNMRIEPKQQWEQQPQQTSKEQKEEQKQQTTKTNDCSVKKIEKPLFESGHHSHGNDCTKDTSTKNNSSCLSSIKANLFVNTPMTQPLSSASMSTSATNETTSASASLIERTSTLLHHLSCMGLIPRQIKEKSGTVVVTDDNNKSEQQSIIQHNKEPHEWFLSLVYNMIEVVCAHQHNYDKTISMEQRTSDTDDINHHTFESEMMLHGLLSILEQILKEVSTSSQEMKYWKGHYHQLLLSGNKSQQNVDPNLTFTNHTQNNTTINEMLQSSQMMSILQQENENLRRQLMEMDPSQLMEMQNQLTGKHMECQRMQEMLQLVEQERNHLRNVCEGKNSTNVRFERDMLTLQNENESVTEENHRLHTEVLKLRQSLNEAENYLRLTEESLRVSTATRNEMITKWNVALKERTMLENELGQSSRERSVMKQQILYNQEEKQRLSQKIESLETNSHNTATEVATLTRENKKLSMELDVMKQSLNKVQEENHRLGHELNSSKMNSDLNSQKTFELEQIAVKTQYDAEAFRNMASELGMERDAIRAMLEEERSKVQKLENMIASSDNREFAASEQIRKLVREKALLVTKLNEANARNVKNALTLNDQSGFQSTPYRSPLSSKTNESMTPNLRSNMKVKHSEFPGMSSFKERLNEQRKANKQPCDEKDQSNAEIVCKPSLTVNNRPSSSLAPYQSLPTSNSVAPDTKCTSSVHNLTPVDMKFTDTTSNTEKIDVNQCGQKVIDEVKKDSTSNIIPSQKMQSQIKSKGGQDHVPNQGSISKTASLLDYLSQEEVSTIT